MFDNKIVNVSVCSVRYKTGNNCPLILLRFLRIWTENLIWKELVIASYVASSHVERQNFEGFLEEISIHYF